MKHLFNIILNALYMWACYSTVTGAGKISCFLFVGSAFFLFLGMLFAKIGGLKIISDPFTFWADSITYLGMAGFLIINGWLSTGLIILATPFLHASLHIKQEQ